MVRLILPFPQPLRHKDTPITTDRRSRFEALDLQTLLDEFRAVALTKEAEPVEEDPLPTRECAATFLCLSHTHTLPFSLLSFLSSFSFFSVSLFSFSISLYFSVCAFVADYCAAKPYLGLLVTYLFCVTGLRWI